MNIIKEEIKKAKDVFKVLGFSKNEIDSHLERMGNLLLMNIFVAALEKKGYKAADGKFNYGEIEDFLKKNFPKEEVENISKEVGKKFISNYFANLLKNVSDEKISEIEAILNSN